MLQIPIAGHNVFLRIANGERSLTFNAWQTPVVIDYDTAPAVPDAGPDIVSYIGPTMDFQSSEGIPLPVFTNFPVTVV